MNLASKLSAESVNLEARKECVANEIIDHFKDIFESGKFEKNLENHIMPAELNKRQKETLQMENNITVNTQNLSKDERELLMKLMEKANSNLFQVNVGDTFKIADIEFIRFPKINGGVPIVSKDFVFDSVFDNDTNDFEKSELLAELETAILPKIEKAVGAENVLEFETDLLALDGSNEYGKMNSKISLPTFDFYRQNHQMFIKYNPNKWWWLATARSTADSIVCHAGYDGTVDYSCCDFLGGVRPFCILKSNIFESKQTKRK